MNTIRAQGTVKEKGPQMFLCIVGFGFCLVCFRMCGGGAGGERAGVQVQDHTCRDQKPTLGREFSPSTFTCNPGVWGNQSQVDRLVWQALLQMKFLKDPCCFVF